jgi:hypothetical protein
MQNLWLQRADCRDSQMLAGINELLKVKATSYSSLYFSQCHLHSLAQSWLLLCMIKWSTMWVLHMCSVPRNTVSTNCRYLAEFGWNTNGASSTVWGTQELRWESIFWSGKSFPEQGFCTLHVDVVVQERASWIFLFISQKGKMWNSMTSAEIQTYFYLFTAMIRAEPLISTNN